jgi:hypothetical protein
LRSDALQCTCILLIGAVGAAFRATALRAARIRYRFFGRSAFTALGAKLADRPGGFGTRTYFGFFASLLPRWPLVMPRTPNKGWAMMVRATACRLPCVAGHDGMNIQS